MIRVQANDFDQNDEYKNLVVSGSTGAIVTFVGRVRDFKGNDSGLFLEHYSGMTEKVLKNIVSKAKARWNLERVRVIHRVGQIPTGEQIVFVGVSSAHRKDAFAACEFIIDILKTEAPFWKKEGNQWVDKKSDDTAKADHWMACE